MTSAGSLRDEDEAWGVRGYGRRGRSTAFDVVGVLLLVAVIAAAAWSLEATPPVLVLGDVVPRPWHPLLVLLALAGASLLAAALLRRRQLGAPRPAAPRWLPVGRAACIGLLATAAAAATAIASVVDGISDFHVLEPASASGCRVVVEERSALLLGSGVVYLLPSGAREAREVASYSADDGYRPVTFGTYSLRWRGDIAHLELHGSRHQPVSYDAEPLAC